MSYYLDMGFVNVKDKSDAFEKANLFCKICKEKYKEVLDLEKYYIPSIRLGKSYEKADMYWVYGVFTYNFVYWEKYNLLGIKGCNFPKEAKDMFDCYIPFQNGTDQDYEFETWGEKINIFNEILNKFKNASYEKIKETIIKKWGSWDEEMDENLEYYRKTCVYEVICNSIDFYNFLDDNDGCFERFSICALNTQKEYLEANRYVKYLVYMEENEKEGI